jgi:hypothetical protein
MVNFSRFSSSSKVSTPLGSTSFYVRRCELLKTRLIITQSSIWVAVQWMSPDFSNKRTQSQRPCCGGPTAAWGLNGCSSRTQTLTAEREERRERGSLWVHADHHHVRLLVVAAGAPREAVEVDGDRWRRSPTSPRRTRRSRSRLRTCMGAMAACANPLGVPVPMPGRRRTPPRRLRSSTVAASFPRLWSSAASNSSAHCLNDSKSLGWQIRVSFCFKHCARACSHQLHGRSVWPLLVSSKLIIFTATTCGPAVAR